MHTWDDAFLWVSRPLGDRIEITGLAKVIETYLTDAK